MLAIQDLIDRSAARGNSPAALHVFIKGVNVAQETVYQAAVVSSETGTAITLENNWHQLALANGLSVEEAVAALEEICAADVLEFEDAAPPAAPR